MPAALRPFSVDIERGRHLPSLPGVDIDGHAVHDYRAEGGELVVTVTWHHRWPVEWAANGSFFREAIALAHGPETTTELHVLDDLVTVMGAPVEKAVEARLIGYVAGLFAADEEVAA